MKIRVFARLVYTTVATFACVGSACAQIHVDEARICCLGMQKDGNLTGLVGGACNGRASCSYKAPTPDEYTRAGVRAAGRQFCTQGMEISFRCGHNDEETVEVPGDAWNHDAAQLSCGGHTDASHSKYETPSTSPRTPAKLGPPDYSVAPSDMLDWTPNPSHVDYTFLVFRPTQPPTPPMYHSSPDRVIPRPPAIP